VCRPCRAGLLGESALRIDGIMHLAWDQPGTIRPVWSRGRLPVLEIPAALQKSATEEAIPLLPGFEAVLLETPEPERIGSVFEPGRLQGKVKRRQRRDLPRDWRPDADWVGKIIARIGHKAGVVVVPTDPATGKQTKHASAHDLRRSCAERLLHAGVPPQVVQMVLRHARFTTTWKYYAAGDMQKAAGALRAYLGKGERSKKRAVDVTR